MKKLSMFLALGVVMMTPLAHAALTISYQVNAGAIVQCASGPGDTLATCAPNPIVSGPVTITTLTGSSNSPGGAPFGNANQSGSTVSVVSTAANTTIKFWFSAPDFNFPVAPPNINWLANLQFTSAGPGAGTINNTNCVDKANGNTPGGPVGQTGYCTNGLLLNNIGLAFNGAGTPQTDTVSTSIATLAGPYALQQMVTLVFNTPGQINFITSQVLSPVPEPTSIVLLGGVLLATAGAIRRKRNQAPQA